MVWSLVENFWPFGSYSMRGMTPPRERLEALTLKALRGYAMRVRLLRSASSMKELPRKKLAVGSATRVFEGRPAALALWAGKRPAAALVTPQTAPIYPAWTVFGIEALRLSPAMSSSCRILSSISAICSCSMPWYCLVHIPAPQLLACY